jgi:triacylglycerol lipase
MRKGRLGAALGAAGLLAAAVMPAGAQAGGMPSDIAAKVAEIGAVINPPATAKLYGPLQEKEPYRGIKVTRDLKYGPDERNLLDVFTPEAPSATPRPVLIFIHGGGFVRGDRRSPDQSSPFYDNVMVFAAHNGITGVNATYRLAPQHPWPAGAQDVGAVVQWVGGNIASYGGNPARVFLMGHSAGAIHVATYVAHPEFHGPKGIGLAGAILVSGLYDLTAITPAEGEKAYYGLDATKYAERSSLAGLVAAKIPLMTVGGELDPPEFRQQLKMLNAALVKAGRQPRMVSLAKNSHMSEVYAINTADTSLSDEILAFVKGR